MRASVTASPRSQFWRRSPLRLEPAFRPVASSLVVSGLTPDRLRFLPGEKLLIAEKGGALKLFDGSSTTVLV
jgi:hypothetical protein